jgi:alkylated DNA repair dioxygenase AlkB
MDKRSECSQKARQQVTRPNQPNLFRDEAEPSTPEGFRYRPDFLSPEEERDLVPQIQALAFEGFQFHGFVGKRRVVSFGWRYDFNDRRLQKADDMPPFLVPLRRRAAEFAGLPPSDFQHALVTEYAPGAGIGWHRDKAVFDEVVGVSLLSPCSFRFRRQQGDKWERAAVTLEPRSAYLLAGPSRTQWEHSIPEMETLRYSITFRNFRGN